MPYAPHRRLTLSGLINGSNAPGVEQFSFGVSLAGADFFGDEQDYFDDLVSDCVAFFSSPGAGICGLTTLTLVTMAKIGPDGSYTDAPLKASPAVVGGGGSSTVQYPPQISLAVSLGTDRYGPTGKGRFYLPTPKQQLSGDYRLSQQDADDCAAAVKTFIDNLNNEQGPDPTQRRVVVASTKGYNSPVTTVRVGRAFDTIRTRREAMLEGYTSPLTIS